MRKEIASPYARNDNSFSTLELCICVFLIGLAILAAIGIYHHFLIQAKEIVLQAELKNLRAVIIFYYGSHGKFPEDLQEMRQKGYIEFSPESAVVRKAHLQLLSADKEGYPLDPFGNRYVYDKNAGDVISGTKGYEKW